MKRINKLISTLIVSTALFTGLFTACEMSLKNTYTAEPEITSSDEYTEVSFTLTAPGTKARTACPVYEWDNYTYELYIKTPGASQSALFIEKSAFSRYLNTRKLPKVSATPYQFTLKGYADIDGIITQVLEGTTGDVYLTSDKQELTFIMYPVEGSTGDIRLIVTFPSDGTITNVKAAVAADRAGTSAAKESLDISQGSDEKVCIFEKTGLQSAVKQYAVFWFYDSQEKLVYSTAESLQILGGKRSDSRIDIKKEFFNRRDVTVTLNKDGGTWTDTNVTVIVKDSDGKTYPLSPNNNGTFSGNIAPGEYEVIVIPDGTSEEIKTGITIDTESEADGALTPTVNFKTVNIENDKVNITPAGGVAGTDTTGNLIVPDGKDFSVKVETKPGYKPSDAAGTPSSGTITVGGKPVSVTENTARNYEGGPVSFNTTTDVAAIESGISVPDSFTPIKYKITYVFKYTEGGNFKYDSVVDKYSVENYVTFPTHSEGFNNYETFPYDLGGWHILPSSEYTAPDQGFDENTYYLSVPQGMTGNIHVRPKWIDKGLVGYTVKTWKEKADSTDASIEANYDITSRTENGTVGDTTSVTAPTLEGFNEPVITQATITAGGDAVVYIKYTRKTINLTLKADGGNWSGSSTEKTLIGKYGATVSNTYGNPARTDYAFDGWNVTAGTLPASFPSSDTTYTAIWKQVNANFTVKYFFEKNDNSGTFEQNPGAYPDVPLKGEIGTETTAPAPSPIEGFTYLTETATITADGSAVVNVKYLRNSVSLNFTLEDTTGGKWSDGTNGKKTVTGKYGCAVTGVPTPTPDQDYSFAGWFTDDVKVEIPSSFPASGKTYTARWNMDRVTYTINYIKDGAAWTGHSHAVSGKAAVGSTTTVTVPEEIPGYTGSVQNIILGTDAAQNIVVVTYVKNEITYKFDPNGGNWSESTEPQEVKGLYGEQITIPGNPSKDGFYFAGWSVSKVSTEKDKNIDNTFGPENKTYYAVWNTYVAGSGTNTFNNVTIQKTAENNLQPVVPYGDEDSWTFIWYDAISTNELGRSSEISITGKGKHSVILLATDTHGTEYTATYELEIK